MVMVRHSEVDPVIIPVLSAVDASATFVQSRRIVARRGLVSAVNQLA